MKYRNFFLIAWLYSALAFASLDVPLEVRESHQIFKGGAELKLKSDGKNIVLIELIFKGVKRTLSGEILSGLKQPDLSTAALKLIASNDCTPEHAGCGEKSVPLVEIHFGGTPELAECEEECIVRFVFEERKVYRRTIARRNGDVRYYQPQIFSSEDSD